MKNIFVIGQCTLHWGRMEFGNIGNYYIIEPFFRELHRVFPQANIKLCFLKSDIPEYSQYKNAFVPGLSIIDVLMFNNPIQVKQMLTNYTLI